MSESTELMSRPDAPPKLADHLPTLIPDVDIFENDDEILLYADMPGVTKDVLSIKIDNGKLVLSGIRRLPSSGAITWKEFTNAEFRRVFSVPHTIDFEKVKAQMQDGVLCLHLPKSESAKPKQIEIKVG